MLVLSRRTGESICIDDHTVLEVLSIRGNVVRLGIKAPADVPIQREELVAGKTETESEGEDG